MNEKWEVPDNAAPEPPDPPKPPKGGFFSPAKPVAERVNDAIEAWYARHFHRAAVEGRAPISATDKADLATAVAEATSKE